MNAPNNTVSYIYENPQYIDFARKTIYIPPSYVATTFSEFSKKLISIRETSEHESTLQAIRQIENYPVDKYLYVDTLNAENFISVLEGEYIDLNASLAGTFREMLITQMSQKERASNREFTVLDSKYVKDNNKRYVLVRGEIRENSKVDYMTQYIITTNGKTFGITLVSKDGDDLENYIKAIK